MSTRPPDSALCANCEQPYGVHHGVQCPGDNDSRWKPAHSGSWTPPTSKWWPAGAFLLDGKINGSIRLAVEVGGRDWLDATDASGQSGVLKPTDRMADGRFLWTVQVQSDHHQEPEWEVVFNKRSTKEILDAMDLWQSRGDYDVVAAMGE